jgi:hypothetical protein
VEVAHSISWLYLSHELNDFNVCTIGIAVALSTTTIFTTNGTRTQPFYNHTIVFHHFTDKQLIMSEPSAGDDGANPPEAGHEDAPEMVRDQAVEQAPPYAYDHGVLTNYNLAASYTTTYGAFAYQERHQTRR